MFLVVCRVIWNNCFIEKKYCLTWVSLPEMTKIYWCEKIFFFIYFVKYGGLILKQEKYINTIIIINKYHKNHIRIFKVSFPPYSYFWENLHPQLFLFGHSIFMALIFPQLPKSLNWRNQKKNIFFKFTN